MAGSLVVKVGCMAAAAGVALLWIAWRLPSKEKMIPRLAGWLLIIAATMLMAATAGAWGVAVGASAGSGAALVILGCIAARSSAAKRVSTRQAPIQTLDARVILGGLPRRIAVFVLVAPGGLLASFIFALGARAASRQAGWADADSNMLALAAIPFGWAMIASLQMTQWSLLRMAALAIAPAVFGVLLGVTA